MKAVKIWVMALIFSQTPVLSMDVKSSTMLVDRVIRAISNEDFMFKLGTDFSKKSNALERKVGSGAFHYHNEEELKMRWFLSG